MSNKTMEHPKILLLDMNDDIKNVLEQKQYNISVGKLGDPYYVKKDPYYHSALLNIKLPQDIAEQEIIILDMQQNPLSHEDQLKNAKEMDDEYNVSHNNGIVYMQPLILNTQKKHIDKILKHGGILILFSFKPIEQSFEQFRVIKNWSFSDFFYHQGTPLERISFQQNEGKEIEPTKEAKNLGQYLSKGTFSTTIKSMAKNKHLLSLAENKYGECVSCLIKAGKGDIFIFPQVEDKAGLIETLFDGILQKRNPLLFSDSTEFQWLKDKAYYLPGHADLLQEKETKESEYISQMEEIEQRIEQNNLENNWLHDLIKETGDPLVKAVLIFLKWLEFENVIDADEQLSEDDLLEEDIRIEGDTTILIEAKGIGGTSSDNNCNQISKIVMRRSKSTKNTNFHGVYIVNHQRHLPPLNRTNPPFNKNQIKDSEYVERGMTTTWELYQLYEKINTGVLLKEDVRTSFYQKGLLNFIPSNDHLIGEVNEICDNGKIIVFDLVNKLLSCRDEIIVEDKNSGCKKVVVENIQIDGKNVEKASSGEVGLKISDKCFKGSKIWKY